MAVLWAVTGDSSESRQRSKTPAVEASPGAVLDRCATYRSGSSGTVIAQQPGVALSAEISGKIATGARPEWGRRCRRGRPTSYTLADNQYQEPVEQARAIAAHQPVRSLKQAQGSVIKS
ncbi:MAG: hypothetical protein U5J63_14425 [Fodinibius sp.]|nr:hypothetical protein [Fodinibius sp.]